MSGNPRRDVLIQFARESPSPVVDVGADHGLVALAVGGIATERFPHRAGRGQRWVIADGLTGFGPLGTAVIAGMGAHTIHRILSAAPPLQRVIVHTPDNPRELRILLASSGWRIIAEALAPEARRYAEIIVAEPGIERSAGLELEFGPVLLNGEDPYLNPHLQQLQSYFSRLAAQTRDTPKHSYFEDRSLFILQTLNEVLEKSSFIPI